MKPAPRPRRYPSLVASAKGCHTTRRRTGTTPYADRVDISLRPLTRGDIPGWADLLARIEKVDHTGEHYGAADMEEEMANPEVVVGKDFVGAFDGQDMVGYYSVLPRGEAEGHFMIHVEGSVLPARRGEGIGTLLVAGMVERAARARAEIRPDLPARLTSVGLTSNLAQGNLLGSAGMRAERWTFVMRTSLDDLPPTRQVPEGYGLRTYDESMSDVLRETHNRAFRDHPNFTPSSENTWKQVVTGSRSFRRNCASWWSWTAPMRSWPTCRRRSSTPTSKPPVVARRASAGSGHCRSTGVRAWRPCCWATACTPTGTPATTRPR